MRYELVPIRTRSKSDTSWPRPAESVIFVVAKVRASKPRTNCYKKKIAYKLCTHLDTCAEYCWGQSNGRGAGIWVNKIATVDLAACGRGLRRFHPYPDSWAEALRGAPALVKGSRARQSNSTYLVSGRDETEKIERKKSEGKTNREVCFLRWFDVLDLIWWCGLVRLKRPLEEWAASALA